LWSVALGNSARISTFYSNVVEVSLTPTALREPIPILAHAAFKSMAFVSSRRIYTDVKRFSVSTAFNTDSFSCKRASFPCAPHSPVYPPVLNPGS
jgi:hypothetical protein